MKTDHQGLAEMSAGVKSKAKRCNWEEESKGSQKRGLIQTLDLQGVPEVQ